MTHEEFLLHYGVKGMRWGQRKTALTAQNLSGERAISYRTKGAAIGAMGVLVPGASMGSLVARRKISKAIRQKTGYKMRELDRRSRKQLRKDVSRYKEVTVRGKDGKMVKITNRDVALSGRTGRKMKEDARRAKVAAKQAKIDSKIAKKKAKKYG